MSSFATFDLFAPLPSPKTVTHQFLVRIGLEPEPFQRWLRDIPDDEASDWSNVVRWYLNHRGGKMGKSGRTEIQRYMDYGLTEQMSADILENAGRHWNRCQRSTTTSHECITARVEDRLAVEVRRLNQ